MSIAAINFAYDNGDLLEKLKQRGNLYSKENYEQVDKVELEIINLVKRNQERYRTPVAAFLIFETEEMARKCLKVYGTTVSQSTGKITINPSGKSLEIFGETLQVQRPFQPSNIIWENQAVP